MPLPGAPGLAGPSAQLPCGHPRLSGPGPHALVAATGFHRLAQPTTPARAALAAAARGPGAEPASPGDAARDSATAQPRHRQGGCGLT